MSGPGFGLHANGQPMAGLAGTSPGGAFATSSRPPDTTAAAAAGAAGSLLGGDGDISNFRRELVLICEATNQQYPGLLDLLQQQYDSAFPAPGAPPLIDGGASPGAWLLIDEGAWSWLAPATGHQQAMNSSPQDHDAAGDSPAPPAISPLTDPADPGNREPSPTVDITAGPDDDRRHHDAPLPPRSNPPSRDVIMSDSELPAHLGGGSLAMTDAALHTMPVSGYLPQSLNAFTSPVRDTTYTGWAGGGSTYHPQTYMAMAGLSNSSMSGMSLAPGPRPMTTIHPSQISGNGAMLREAEFGLSGGLPDPSLESFARLEFADSVFQMTTYAVIIGRDQNALNAAKRDKRRADEHQRRIEEARAKGLPDPPAPSYRTLNKFSKSYVSNEGGMLGPESDGSGEVPDRRAAKRRKRFHADSAEQPAPEEPEADDMPVQDDPNIISDRQYISHTPGAVAVNVAALRTSPYEVPFIGIHSPHPNIITGTRGISRQHLKIQFSAERGVFEAIPLHINGFFIRDDIYRDEKVTLRSGDTIQIRDVTFDFVINGVPRGKTGAEDYLEDESEPETAEGGASEGPKEMSLAFESRHPENKSTSVSMEPESEDVQMEDQPGPEPAPALPKPGEALEGTRPREISASPEGDGMDVDQDVSGIVETIEEDGDHDADADGEEHAQPVDAKPSPPVDLAALLGLEPMATKKRGPGRPPKNGFMSKREERLRKKAAQELQKKNAPPTPQGEPPIKRKVGRPRKHPLPDDAGGDRPEKRRYKPRKKNGEEGGESDGERNLKEKRREKPKTPPPELERSNYTEEQLQKPNKNYGVLIDEVLTAALPDGLTLKQIYKRIQIRYPYYYFSVDTKGWESSVRHNLIGNEAFKKDEETHLWRRVPGIDIDAGKKRKAPSPDNAGHLPAFTQQQYQGPNTYGSAPNYHQSAAAPHAGYPNGPTAGPSFAPLPAPALAGMSSQPPRQTHPNPGQTSAPAQVPAYQQAAAGRPPSGVSQGPTHSAPYVPVNAPVPMAAQPGATPHSMARQYTQLPNGAGGPNGLPQAGRTQSTPAAHTAQPVPGPPQQPAATVNAPLKPAVAPKFVSSIVQFKTAAQGNLAKRCSAPNIVASAAVHRALGLTTQPMEAGDETLVTLLQGVFEKHKATLIDKGEVRADEAVLHPDLLQALLTFKSTMIKTIEKMVGSVKGEQLILSAIDRALGFSHQSNVTVTAEQMAEYNKAEDVLIEAIGTIIVKHQRALADVDLQRANSAGTTAPNYRPAAQGSVAAATQASPANTTVNLSTAPAAMARPAVAYPPRPPVQAANAHATHVPAAAPAGYRPPPPAPPARPAGPAASTTAGASRMSAPPAAPATQPALLQPGYPATSASRPMPRATTMPAPAAGPPSVMAANPHVPAVTARTPTTAATSAPPMAAIKIESPTVPFTSMAPPAPMMAPIAPPAAPPSSMAGATASAAVAPPAAHHTSTGTAFSPTGGAPVPRAAPPPTATQPPPAATTAP